MLELVKFGMCSVLIDAFNREKGSVHRFCKRSFYF